MVFFREQDIVFGYHITKLGRSVVMVSRPDKHGHYKIVARTVPRVDPMVSWAYAFGQGFDYLEARINRVEDIPRHTETIIEDPDLILSNATGDHT